VIVNQYDGTTRKQTVRRKVVAMENQVVKTTPDNFAKDFATDSPAMSAADVGLKVSGNLTRSSYDTTATTDALTVAREFDHEAGIDGAILTKLDGDARGGAAISFRSVCGKPIKLIGVGEGVDDLRVFDPARMVSRILGMGDVLSLVEKAEEVFDEKQARQWEKKLRRSSFDLEDFREQMRQFSKVGSWSALMEMLPSSLPRPAGGEDRLKRMGAILDSMTPGERHHPEIIGGSRRERIARGSGTSVPEVNRLLKEFNMSRKMFGKTGKLRNRKIKLGGVNWPL
jgi:signal recognition particle subunit SRP54